jgi:hypothetical protein
MEAFEMVCQRTQYRGAGRYATASAKIVRLGHPARLLPSVGAVHLECS